MSNNAPLWNDVDELYDLFLEVEGGDEKVFEALAQALSKAEPRRMSDWPKPVRDCWTEGLRDYILESVDPRKLSAAITNLVHALAPTGYDLPKFRDCLATLARQQFSSYPDPAGMMEATGIYKTSVPTDQIARRVEVMKVLEANVHIFEPSQGIGTVTKVDGIVNEIRILFEREVVIELATMVDAFVVIRPGSLLDSLISGTKKWSGAETLAALRSALEDNLAWGKTPTQALLKSILVPHVVNAKSYKSSLASASPKAEDKPAIRPWEQARGIVELAGLLADQEVSENAPEGIQEITSILCSSAQRPDQASELCEVLSRLWRARGDTQWVRDLVDQIGAEAICWSDSTLFAQLSDDLAGKLVPAWFRTTQKVMGPDYVAKHCLDLPLRLWAHVEKIFGEDSATSDLLLERATAQLRSRDTSSDAILWAWKSRNAAKDLIASSPLVFKTLAKTLHGSYLKANRDLRKLLMENEAFQSHLMRGGEDQAIISLVNSVRHLPLLDTGERQSLLVRIVRIFPDARKLVEEKHGQPTMQAIARQTSVRMYEIRRLELEEIINVKIPANSRAIGHAREYGDLRENAEFKAAKEEQVFLTARRNELEVDLHEIRATDFSDVEPNEVVVPGTTVKLQTEEDNVVHTYHVLGLWDSVPERQMLSYDTPLGKLLTGARVGDELELPSEETAELIEVLELPDEIKEWVKISSLDES